MSKPLFEEIDDDLVKKVMDELIATHDLKFKSDSPKLSEQRDNLSFKSDSPELSESQITNLWKTFINDDMKYDKANKSEETANNKYDNGSVLDNESNDDMKYDKGNKSEETANNNEISVFVTNPITEESDPEVVQYIKNCDRTVEKLDNGRY